LACRSQAKNKPIQKMIFPKDAKTISTSITNIGSEILVSDIPSSVLSVRIQQSGIQSETEIYCGSHIIAHNYAKDYSIDLGHHICYDPVVMNKTGAGDTAFATLTYVPYDINKNDTSSTSPYFINGFSYGEIVLSIFLFLIFIIIAFKCFWSSIFHKKITLRKKIQ